MKRMLGVVVMSIGILVPLGQSAEANFTATGGNYPLAVSGGQSEPRHVISFGVRNIVCKGVALEGELTEALPTLELAAEYTGCESSWFGPSTVQTNGCRFLFHTTAVSGLSLVCPEGQQIEIRTYGSAARHSEGKVVCLMNIGPQGPVGTVSFKNVGTGAEEHVVVSTSTSLKIAITGPAFACLSATSFTYSGSTALSGIADGLMVQ